MALVLVTLLLNGAARAHVIGAHDDTLAGQRLAGPATTLILIAVAFFAYAAGVLRTIGEGKASRISPLRLLAFAGGMIVLVIALQSPLDIVSADLFSAHMVQHLLLMLAAPPLLVWSDCPIVFLRALPRNTRKAVARFWAGGKLGRICQVLMHPLIAWIAFCGAFVFWHAPGPYQWALHDSRVHILEHLSFFITALAFWSIVLPSHAHRRRLPYGPTLLFVISTAVLGGLPGALMIFAPRPLYPAHAAGVAKWGLTLLQDQQLAGLIMWIPAGAAYVAAVVLVFLAWLREAETGAIRAARRAVPAALIVALAVLLLAACKPEQRGIANFAGDPKRGAALIDRYGCGGCHDIPSIANANGNVGPPLDRVGSRTIIAGYVSNSPENMALWVENPQKMLPGNAMPSMGISHKDARDITAFLYTLR